MTFFELAAEITGATRPRTLLDTADRSDATYLGYDNPTDPSEDGMGFRLTVDTDPMFGHAFRLLGPDGEIVLGGVEAEAVALAILRIMSPRQAADVARQLAACRRSA